MHKRLSWLSASLVLALSIAVTPSPADEEKVPLDKVPKAVLETVKARFKGADLTGATKEKEGDKTVYEVTIKFNEHKIDVTVTPEGDLVLIEKQIAAKDLPKAVAKALEEKYPKATYKIVEEIIKVEQKKEKLTHYEVLLVTADRKGLEVQLAPDGKILKEEKKSAEKDE